MCWPSKKQKNNFSEDEPKKAKPASTPAPAATPAPATAKETPAAPATATTTAAPSEAPAAAAAPQITTAIPNGDLEQKRQPKIGIIIYSMYGHVAKREFSPDLDIVSHLANLLPVAEQVKLGIEETGGKATIYQCVNFHSCLGRDLVNIFLP
jgi:NAD(P)H dehydrogenase (quinone)